LEEWLDFHITTYLAQQPRSEISNGIVTYGDAWSNENGDPHSQLDGVLNNG